ncbi:MAG: hypothetical protein JWN24_1063 [Phycisphaerales bacterium]|nr:hypothetical protein [Phycisphaerales bacterium]
MPALFGFARRLLAALSFVIVVMAGANRAECEAPDESAPQSAAAVAARTNRDAAVEKAQTAFAAAKASAVKQYLDDLAGTIKTAMKAGNLDEAKRIDALRARLESGAAGGDAKETQPPKTIAATTAKTRYDGAVKKAEASLRSAKILADQQYQENLGAPLRAAMKASYLDESKRIDAARKAIDLEIAELQRGTVRAEGRKVVNLLALVDLRKDVVRGSWKLTPDGLASENDHPLIRFSYHPPAEYDFHVEYTRQKGSLWVLQAISHNDVSLGWNMKSDGTCGFEWVNGKNVDDEKNVTRVRLSDTLDKGRHVSVVQVRKNSICAYVDGKLAMKYQTDWTGLHDGPEYSIGRGLVGLMTYDTPTVFHVAEVVEVTGEGKIVSHEK